MSWSALTGEILHPPQKFESPPFWNVWSYGIRNCGVEVNCNGMMSRLSFIKVYQLVQKLIGRWDRHRQEGNLISLHFYGRKESKLKAGCYSDSGFPGFPQFFQGNWCNSKAVSLRQVGEEYSSYSFLILAVDGWVVSVTPRPRFTPVPIGQEALCSWLKWANKRQSNIITPAPFIHLFAVYFTPLFSATKTI
jgi:hypothetical protein